EDHHACCPQAIPGVAGECFGLFRPPTVTRVPGTHREHDPGDTEQPVGTTQERDRVQDQRHGGTAGPSRCRGGTFTTCAAVVGLPGGFPLDLLPLLPSVIAGGRSPWGQLCVAHGGFSRCRKARLEDTPNIGAPGKSHTAGPCRRGGSALGQLGDGRDPVNRETVHGPAGGVVGGDKTTLRDGWFHDPTDLTPVGVGVADPHASTVPGRLGECLQDGHGPRTGWSVLGQWDVTSSDRGDLVTGPQRKYGRPGRLHGRGCLGGGGSGFGTAYLGLVESHRSVTALGNRVVTQLT